MSATVFAHIVATTHCVDWPDVLIFSLTYFGLALGDIPFTRLDRSSIAILGAVAVLLFHRMDLHAAMAGVDFPTLILLISMMIISAQLRLAGFYDWVVRRIVQAAHQPWHLLAGLIIFSALLSALFANDVICLIFTPVLCLALQKARRDPVPYLMALATASNIGSASTLIGNPQNMLIGETAHLNFGGYFLTVLPLILVCLLLNYAAIAVIYHTRLFSDTEPPSASVAAHEHHHPPVMRWHLIIKSLLVMGILLVAMLAESIIHVSRPVAAMAAAGVILVSRKTRPVDLFALVDWNLILLFIGLFMVIADVQSHHLLAPALRALTQAGVSLQSHLSLACVTLTLSNIVSNVPAVLLIKPAIPPAATHAWYLLAVVSTLAGNLTLLGSIANLIVSQQAEPFAVKLRFREYLKAGVPLTLCSVTLAVLYFKMI
ncbi:MAG: anion transporter [Planctomycetes bacterium]|nr:anion transporter [Planctomycetota bacterium]